MSTTHPRVLLVSDPTYPAAGRDYGREDAELSRDLGEHFGIALCRPAHAASLMDAYDVVLVRNSGPVEAHRTQWEAFRTRALADRAVVYNALNGAADMIGKQYLVDLTAEGYPVIPTADRISGLDALGDVEGYIVKPRSGADSRGVVRASRVELSSLDWDRFVVQPRVEIVREISFVFIDRVFQYAVSTVDPAVRWGLQPFDPTEADLRFAQTFVDWNPLAHGIQRVDACLTGDGRLLLVELEDLNPYLSLDCLQPAARSSFISNLVAALRRLVDN